MPAPISSELRKKIIMHKQNGEKERDIAKWLLINQSTVTKIWKQFREENTIENKVHKRGRKPAFCNNKMTKIREKIKKQPDITLDELVEHFKLNISISALSRKLTKLDLTFKKRRCFQRNSSALMSSGFGESGWTI
jgi:transposase